MAKVKWNLNSRNLVLLENGPLIQKVTDNDQFTCTSVNCTNLACSNGCKNSLNNYLKNASPSQLTNQQTPIKLNEPSTSANLNFLINNLNKNLFKNSIYTEVVKNNKFKDKKANLIFPRKFVNSIKKESNEDGSLKVSKKVTKTCVLQPSLFENIPPTIYFGLEDELIERPSSKISPFLIWRLSSITPTLIRETVLKSGFKLIKESSTDTRWICTWCKHLKTFQYAELNSNQKVNHFPGSFNFGRKDRLWTNIRTLCINANETSEEHAFHPDTYILPADIKLLKQTWTAKPEMKMILKPPASARGIGIQVIHKFKQIPKESKTKQVKGPSSQYIAQNYIEKPLLLFNQTKFDIRLYVLITSFDPLRLYLYDDGLIRFASEKYSTNIDDLNNQFMHLTNYSINKKSETYKQNNDESSLDGHKWTLKTFLNYISKNMKEVCIKKLSERIVDLVLKTVISCQYPVFKYLLKNQKYKYNNFELLGFDIMLDGNFKPWLLEVNVSPSLRSESSVDTSVKSQLIKDTFNIVGYRLPMNYSDDPLNYTLTELEIQKHCKFEEEFNKLYEKTKNANLNEICTYDFNLTENLLPDDIRHLCLAEDELSRCGSFIRLFPSKISEDYLAYFARPFYRNYLVIEWERKFSNRREEAVAYLQQLCKQKLNMMGNPGQEEEQSNSDESD